MSGRVPPRGAPEGSGLDTPGSTTRRVTVVGGGLAGITAALDCADGGAEVTLIERKNYLGGATYSFERNGLRFDNGQHVFMRCCDRYISLLDRLGVKEATRMQDRLDVPVLRARRPNGRLHRSRLPRPLHLAGSFARYQALSPLERLSAARAMLAVSKLDPADPSLDFISFGAWLARHGQGSAEMERLWDLLIKATCNLPAQTCSLGLAANVIKTGFFDTATGADIGWSKVPLSELHGDAAQAALGRSKVHLLTGTTVESIDGGEGNFTVSTSSGPHRADAVIVALGHQGMRRILPPGVLTLPVEDLGSSPIVNVQLVLDRRVTDRPIAAVLDSPVQWVFDRTEAVGAHGGQCLGVTISAADDWLARRPREIAGTVLQALAEVIPAVGSASLTDAVVTKERHATFLATPGSARLRPGPRTEIAGLFLAGAWTQTGWPATMEGAVRSGEAAARAVIGPISDAPGNDGIEDETATMAGKGVSA